MKIPAKPSMIISRPVARFLALLNSLKTASVSNTEERLDLLKKYSDGTMPTTIVAQKAHKGRPGECNKFRIVENLKRMRAKLYFDFINKIVCAIDYGKIVNRTDQSFDGAVESRKKIKTHYLNLGLQMCNFLEIFKFVYIGNQFVYLSKPLILEGLKNLCIWATFKSKYVY